MSGIRKRALSLGKRIGAPVAPPVELATVISVGAGTVDIRKGDGAIMRRVPLVGSASVGDKIQIQTNGGKTQALASGGNSSGGFSGGSNGATGATPITYTGAPSTASYLTRGADSALSNERVFTKGNGLTEVDGGPGGAYTLAVGQGTGITVNANDVAVNTSANFTWSGTHVFTNGLYIGPDVLLSRIGANILALGSGDSFQSQGFVSGVSGWQINYAGDIEANNILARGSFRASVFNVSEITAYAGTLFVGPSAGVLYEDFTSPASVGGTGTLKAKNSDSGGSLFALGSRLRIKTFTGSGIGDSWLEVTGAITNNTTHTLYPVTLRSGSTSIAYKVGTGITDWGPSGSNIITASADGTIGAAANISLITHAGSPWSSQSLVARWGNLTGVTDPFFGAIPSGTNGIYTNSGYFNNVNIKGNLVIGPGVGFSVAPLLYCAFDTGGKSYRVNTNGHLGQAASITGGVNGGTGKFRGGAVAIGQGVTNMVTNPRFAHATFNTNWSAGANCAALQALNSDALYGSRAAYLSMSGTNNRAFYTTVTRSSTSAGVTVSAWVKCVGGTANVKIGLWKSDLSAANESADFVVGSDWKLIYHAISGTSINTWTTTNNVLIRNDTDNGTTKVIVVGAVQAEETYFVSPFFDGSAGSGFAWTGTAHNSTSTRTEAVMSHLLPLTGTVGTISAWFMPSGGSSGASADYRVILHSGTANYVFVRVNPSNQLEARWGNLNMAGGAVTNYAWQHALLTCDGTTAYLYLNGVQVASTTSISTVAAGVAYIGSFGNNQWLNGFIDDLFISDKYMDINDVTALYQSNAPVAVTRSNYELVLSDTGAGSVVANAGGIYGTGPSGLPNFTLLNSQQTVNGESMSEGSVMFGDNSSGRANMRWDNSAGALLFRSGTTTITKIETDGTMTFNVGSGTGTDFNVYAPIGAINFVRPSPTVRLGELQSEYSLGVKRMVKLTGYSDSTNQSPAYAIVKAQQDGSGASTATATALLMANDGTTGNSGFGTLSAAAGANADKQNSTSQSYLQALSSANYGKVIAFMDSTGANVDITALHGSEYARIVLNSLSNASRVSIYGDKYEFLQGGYFYIANVSSAPAAIGGGGVLYVEAGALKYKGSSGTLTTIAAA